MAQIGACMVCVVPIFSLFLHLDDSGKPGWVKHHGTNLRTGADLLCSGPTGSATTAAKATFPRGMTCCRHAMLTRYNAPKPAKKLRFSSRIRRCDVQSSSGVKVRMISVLPHMLFSEQVRPTHQNCFLSMLLCCLCFVGVH